MSCREADDEKLEVEMCMKNQECVDHLISGLGETSEEHSNSDD